MDIALILIVIIILAAKGWRHYNRFRSYHKETRPALLHGAKLFMSERRIETKVPVPLRGQPDQVFQLKSNEKCIIDTKRRWRARYYPDDQVQLSVYRCILENMGERVHPWGYIRCAHPNGRASYVKVPLLDESVIVGLYKRRNQLLRGDTNPKYARTAIFCDTCGHRKGCKGA